MTERLVLRELRVTDALAVAAGAGDRRVAQYLIAVPSPYPIALARRWVLHRIEWWKLGRGVTFGVAAEEIEQQQRGARGIEPLRRHFAFPSTISE